jgi:hypothetical protein
MRGDRQKFWFRRGAMGFRPCCWQGWCVALLLIVSVASAAVLARIRGLNDGTCEVVALLMIVIMWIKGER